MGPEGSGVHVECLHPLDPYFTGLKTEVTIDPTGHVYYLRILFFGVDSKPYCPYPVVFNSLRTGQSQFLKTVIRELPQIVVS